ncbi:MAG: 5'-nucleotidase, lipoprotein e(P4) family [Deltaproteobacteria bacterium]|nr:MAG: 5'-nucleotidase, lipoprotein e(P4) family [Deltaproteobacteria bacterium]
MGEDLKRLFTLVVLTLFFTSCSTTKVSHNENSQEYLLASTLWMQNAAEVRALTYQAYNIARLRLDHDLKYNKSKKKRAIVVDADETVIDNSPYQARNILTNESYTSENWNKWVQEAQADAVPGAVEFLSYAASKGVEVFYITNRKVNGFEATYINLKNLGFPVKKKNMMLRTDGNSKTERRAKVLENHRIVLLMGDTLADFSEIFEHKSSVDRKKLADEYRQEFGRKFIVLPNPMYGDWEQALYDYKGDLERERLKELRLKNLDPGK